MGDKGWREERGAQDTLTNHCQRRRPRVTAGGRGWRGQRRFIGLNLTLVQARHIVSDKLFTRAPGGRTQTLRRVLNAPSGGESSPTGKVARMSAEVGDPTRAIGMIREIHPGMATERQDREMEDVKTLLLLTPFVFFSSGGISVQSASPPGLSGAACACGQ